MDTAWLGFAADVLQVDEFLNGRVRIDPVATGDPDARETKLLDQAAEVLEGDVLHVSTRDSGKQCARLHQTCGAAVSRPTALAVRTGVFKAATINALAGVSCPSRPSCLSRQYGMTGSPS